MHLVLRTLPWPIRTMLSGALPVPRVSWPPSAVYICGMATVCCMYISESTRWGDMLMLRGLNVLTQGQTVGSDVVNVGPCAGRHHELYRHGHALAPGLAATAAWETLRMSFLYAGTWRGG